MIHERRLHLDLSAADRAACRDETHHSHGVTPEQAAILSLLDRVEWLERKIKELEVSMQRKNDDEPTIEELCKPLSAKVMPKRAMHNIGGREMDEARSLSSQRHAISMKRIRAGARKA